MAKKWQAKKSSRELSENGARKTLTNGEDEDGGVIFIFFYKANDTRRDETIVYEETKGEEDTTNHICMATSLYYTNIHAHVYYCVQC